MPGRQARRRCSTLADWVGKSTPLLESLADTIGGHVLADQAIVADDTPIELQAPDNGKTELDYPFVSSGDDDPVGPWLDL